MVSAQVVFHEDFGSSDVRLPSMFVPQGGNDTQHYKFADPNGTGDDYNRLQIDNGYYAVAKPSVFPIAATTDGTTGWWPWNISNWNSSDLRQDGSVMAVNAGSILNQFYRRSAKLEKGQSYEMKAFIRVANRDVKIAFEAQNILDDKIESVLGNKLFPESRTFSSSDNTSDGWIELIWNFTVPNDSETCGNIAVSIRNMSSQPLNNDFYIDDITLTKVTYDSSYEVIDCAVNTDIATVIKANDNTFTFGPGIFNIISDDSINGNVGTVNLSGILKNANISTLGNWPVGISLNTLTGEIDVADGTTAPSQPLKYQICNLLGVCSTANITFNNGSVSTDESSIFTLKSEVLETCFTGNANNQKVRYTLKNVSGNVIETKGESGTSSGNKKIRLIGSNINVNSFNVISGDIELGDGALGYLRATTIDINEEFIFELEYDYSNLSDEIIGGLEFRYGNSTASGQMVNPDIKLNVSNSISRTPSKPNNIIKVLNETGSFTVYQASGLNDAVVNFKFYNSAGVEIPYNTPVDMSFTGELVYSYSRISASGCESEKSFITLSKTEIELPQSGQISLSSSSLLESQNICPTNYIIDEAGNVGGQNPIKIFNNQDGQGTYVTAGGARYALKYSWEVSYDDGIIWNEFSDSDGNQEGDTSNGRKEITLQNIKSNVWIRRKAQERPEGTRPNRYSYSNIIKINVQNNDINILGGNYHSRALTFLDAEDENGELVLNTELNKFIFPEITTTIPSTIQIIDETGRVFSPGDTFNFTSEGTYTFTVKAITNAGADIVEGCEVLATISLTVYDLNKCKVVVDKVIATAQPENSGWGTTLAGLVANKENAYDNDMSTHSTISVMVGLLGLGTTWQNLYFDHVVPAGTPLKVKLGQEYSGVQLAGGITIVGLDENGNAIGSIKSVGEGALLDALAGDNVFEFTFVPTNNSGVAKPYKGVRVILGSLLAVANNAVLYGAYYEKERILDNDASTVQEPIFIKGAKLPVSNTQENQLRYLIPTTPEDVIVLKPENTDKGIKLNSFVSDVSWGNQDAGLGVATALSSVVYPYLSVDDDPLTYTIFNKTVGALNVQSLDVRLRRIARPGDELELIMTNEGTNLLSLDLGADFTVQRYMDDVPVGPEVASNAFKVINLNLFLFKDPIPRFRVAGISQPFNRVVFKYLSIVQANLGNQMYLHDVSIVPQSVFDDNLNITDNVELCAADFIKIKKPSVCTEYKVNFVLGQEVQKEVLNPDGTTSTITSYDELEDVILPESVLNRVYENENEAYYEIKKLYDLAENQILLLKVQTVQNGEDFGGPQFIRVTLKNCLESIVNPVLTLDAKELN